MGAEKLIFSKSKWTPEVANILKPATGDDEPIIAAEVEAGISECWEIKDHGYMVTRLETEPEKTLVVVAGAGRKAGEVWQIMPNIARANGAKWIRVHSKRPGMFRVLKPLGYEVKPGNGEKIYLKRVQ